MYDDLIHFTPSGYDTMGEIVYETLEPWLSKFEKEEEQEQEVANN